MTKPGQGIRTIIGVTAVVFATTVLFYGLRHFGEYIYNVKEWLAGYLDVCPCDGHDYRRRGLSR